MSRRRGSIPVALLIFALALSGCSRSSSREERRIPTGARLDPAGTSIPLGSMPLAMTLSPDSSRVVSISCGFREQGIQVIDLKTRRVVQTVVQPSAFLGLAFARDGHSLYVSGGNQDVVYRYLWAADTASLADSLQLDRGGYPSGLAVSNDGLYLYVAQNMTDSLAVVELASGRIVQRFATGRYPYAVVVGPDERVYVSAWGGHWVASFARNRHLTEVVPTPGPLAENARIPVDRHPSAMVLNTSGTRLFVARASFDQIAVVDTRRDTVIASLTDAAEGPAEGATPNALALSPDGRRLYVAEADNNATAVFELSTNTADLSGGPTADSLIARIPVEWYPTAVMANAHTLYVLNGKGKGTGPNPGRRQPGRKVKFDPFSYTLGQTSGSLTLFPLPADRSLAALSKRVSEAEGWAEQEKPHTYPPFNHVIYIIKENRTYDQIFGDVAAGDGDTALVYFPRSVTPNHHALADRFGLFDRFHVNAEVSGDGHNWTTAAYAADYVEKTIPSNYSGRGRTYDFEGENRDTIPEDDVNEPGNGYLWDAADHAGVTIRNYGEFTLRKPDGTWTASKPFLAAHTCPNYPGWDLDIQDQVRVDVWQKEFQQFVTSASLPALTFLWLPNDHTAGAKSRAPTPRAMVADNDVALGRVIETLSHSPYWKDTVVFVLEDDAQDGPDHVDSHRSPLLVISPYNRSGVYHRFANTSDVIATIVDILHMKSLSQFDHFGRPLWWTFASTPDLTPYTLLKPEVSLEERNPEGTANARLTERLDFAREDAADEELFNQILWAVIKGPDRPYPDSGERDE